ncbi:LOW QUALITY PROTEIN: hypothetical protein AAY473_004082 [Plecturocebus cupreus]
MILLIVTKTHKKAEETESRITFPTVASCFSQEHSVTRAANLGCGTTEEETALSRNSTQTTPVSLSASRSTAWSAANVSAAAQRDGLALESSRESSQPGSLPLRASAHQHWLGLNLSPWILTVCPANTPRLSGPRHNHPPGLGYHNPDGSKERAPLSMGRLVPCPKRGSPAQALHGVPHLPLPGQLRKGRLPLILWVPPAACPSGFCRHHSDPGKRPKHPDKARGCCQCQNGRKKGKAAALTLCQRVQRVQCCRYLEPASCCLMGPCPCLQRGCRGGRTGERDCAEYHSGLS